MGTLTLGIDLGTSAVKALLLRTDGAVVAMAGAPCVLSTPRPKWSEQDPNLWWQATIEALRGLWRMVPGAAAEIGAIGLSGQMHGLVLLAANGATLRPCLLWNDQRSAEECDQLQERFGLDGLVRMTGNRVYAGFTLPKLLWVRTHEPAVFAATRQILLPKDWLRWRLTGAFASDVSDASGTAMFDVGARRYSAELLAALDLDPALLPPTFESMEVTSTVGLHAAKETGLRAGTPVVAGAGDQAASALGLGLLDEGACSVTIGTSGVVFAPRRTHRPDPQGRLHAFCHAVPGRWHQMGVMLSAGASLRWFRDTIALPEVAEAARRGIDPYQLIDTLASSAPPGADGVTFLPYLSGERTPHADPNATGAFLGLTGRHTRGHLARAVLEGVTFGLCDCLDLLRGTGLAVTRLTLAGGGARSPLWRQLCADVFGCEVVGAQIVESSALGAARLAAEGIGAEGIGADAGALKGTRRAQIEHPAGGSGELDRPGLDTPGLDSAVARPVTHPELAAALGRFRALYPAIRRAENSLEG